MPISETHKLIFIHIAKNAGTSVIETLSMENIGHHRFDYYKRKYPEKWETYRKFAIIRNSWDRFVSSYEFARMAESDWHSITGKKVRGPHPDYFRVKSMSFVECAAALLKDPNTFQHQGWLPQKQFIHDGEKIVADILIDFANVNDELSSKLGFAISVKNRSQRCRPMSLYYNEQTIEIISEIYKEDIELFKFTYESERTRHKNIIRSH